MAAAGDAPAELPLSAAGFTDMLLMSFGEAGTDLLVPAGLLQPAGDAPADMLVAPGAVVAGLLGSAVQDPPGDACVRLLWSAGDALGELIVAARDALGLLLGLADEKPARQSKSVSDTVT